MQPRRTSREQPNIRRNTVIMSYRTEDEAKLLREFLYWFEDQLGMPKDDQKRERLIEDFMQSKEATWK